MRATQTFLCEPSLMIRSAAQCIVLRDDWLRRSAQDEANQLQLAAGAAASAGLSAFPAGLAPSAGAALAAFAASSAFALRSLRGMAFSGLFRFGRFMIPAVSRKRITRSDGCAPFFIQAWTLSRSSLSRSVFSFGSSGLK